MEYDPNVHSFQDYHSSPAEYVEIDLRHVISAAPSWTNYTEVHWHPPGGEPQTRALIVPFGQFCELVARKTNRCVTFETHDLPMKRVERHQLATHELPF